ncbi:preprotein translocase subunit SecD [Nocardioides sp. B-3]|uniref:preprotein translocase subunit SecD n=1 Tax=Nocardioides sp. B-3 TaxID=2895565 RepID=UPI0021520327|nr:hypothetical protein [Nocardioides sp. B-3]UUZ59369.1 hypothetical protein LP418_26670 [Nocardioides sp. B-3]
MSPRREVSTRGNKYIVVEIPGESRRDLVETVKRRAQLRFRVVAAVANGVAGATNTVPSTGNTTVPTAPPTSRAPGGNTGGNNRAPYALGRREGQEERDEVARPRPRRSRRSPEEPAGDEDPLVWMDNPDAKSVAAFNEFSCPASGEPPTVEDDPDKPLITCDELGQKMLLSKTLIEGTDLSSADTLPPSQQSVEWGVDLNFNRAGTVEFARISRAPVNTQKQFAIVLDGRVISAPTMEGLINDGNAQITGQFTEAEARSPATSLKYGALPISFEKDPPVELVGPSLAGNQLSAGIQAGLAGLLLVMLYCLFYYRGSGSRRHRVAADGGGADLLPRGAPQ